MSQTEARKPTDDPAPVSIEKIASLAKRRGFVYPNSEIYGGVPASMTSAHSALNCATTFGATGGGRWYKPMIML